MNIRWKKSKALTGLAAVGAGKYRRSDLHDGINRFATVYPMGGNWRGPLQGWYWTVPENKEYGIPYENTCGSLCETEQEAKDAAKAYVLPYLNKVKP